MEFREVIISIEEDKAIKALINVRRYCEMIDKDDLLEDIIIDLEQIEEAINNKVQDELAWDEVDYEETTYLQTAALVAMQYRTNFIIEDLKERV